MVQWAMKDRISFDEPGRAPQVGRDALTPVLELQDVTFQAPISAASCTASVRRRRWAPDRPGWTRMNLPRHWRLRQQRYSLVGEVCTTCGARLFPPRDVCPECSRPAPQTYRGNGNGRLHPRRLLYWTLDGCEEFVPYTVQMAGLDERPAPAVRVAGRIAGRD
jgi:uncharacterized OB-fold protein